MSWDVPDCPATSIGTFWQRFGAAILVSVIDGAVQAAAQSPRGESGAVIENPSASQDVLTEVLKNTINIPPTVVKKNGDRIQVLVARDLDFRTVYELRSRECRPLTPASPPALALDPARVAAAVVPSADVLELCINRPLEAYHRDTRRLASRDAAVGGLRLVPAARQAGRQLHPPAHRRAPRRCCPLRCRPASASRSSCRRPPPRDASRSQSAVRPARSGPSMISTARGIFRRTRRADHALDDTERELLRLLAGGRLRGLHAPGGEVPQEHPGVGPHGFRKDHLDQGADPGNSRRTSG